MKNILEYLEITEQEHPDCRAVDDGSMVLTWRELAELSRKIGTAIAEETEPGRPVVLLAEKSSFMLASMFGTVYAGCFYVVVDPSQPPQRIQKILNVLEPEVLIINEYTDELVTETGYKGKTCFMEELAKGKENREVLKKIRSGSKETDILYGIFTSGSTGTPKGVVVSHQAVIKFITHFVDLFGFDHRDRIANQAPFDFDVSVKDIYTSLFTGGELIIIPKKLFSVPPLLMDYLSEKEVTTLIWAVSALSLIASLRGLEYKVPKTVKKVLFSGEVMPLKTLRKWQTALPYAEYVNLYGPAEITCNCTYYRIRGMVPDEARIPIGRKFPGRDVFLLSEDGEEIVSQGTIGEICVSGESLSEGYYHNPEETKKRFVLLKRGRNNKMRCYKTGDLGYYGNDGMLYFSGRKDFQIKHMGHRIELEEIERAMEQIRGLERCLCVMDQKRNRLAAFYIGSVEPAKIKEQMKMKLPVYMIPHQIIRTNSIPLNKNGKADRVYFRQKLR